MIDAADKTAALLAGLWVRIRPIVEERLVILDRAAAASKEGELPGELRVEAASAAHKLAGSLGMYGFDEGTRVAREIEVLLDRGTPDAARLNALVTELRTTIPSA